ncbi:hypothetical protein ACMA1D_07070 [Streptomyces sp. 796.1]|uniref:hypothetical protein n=1 Tax=Streptomyces sp. 796.1 TaxID=3163029 RepID=UPI0039C8D1F4
MAKLREAMKKNGKKYGSFRMTGTARQPGEPLTINELVITDKPKAVARRTYVPSLGGEPQMEFRLVDGWMYYKGDAESSEGLGDTPWIKGSKRAPELLDGAFDGAAKDSAPDTSAVDGLRKIGKEVIEGVRTTHYRGTTPVDRMSAALRDSAKNRDKRLQNAATMSEFKKWGIKRFTVDIWVDDARLQTKRYRMRSNTPKGLVERTLTFQALPKGFVLKPPPADQVVDESDLVWEDE